jgi:hypothetical protein
VIGPWKEEYLNAPREQVEMLDGSMPQDASHIHRWRGMALRGPQSKEDGWAEAEPGAGGSVRVVRKAE